MERGPGGRHPRRRRPHPGGTSRSPSVHPGRQRMPGSRRSRSTRRTSPPAGVRSAGLRLALVPGVVTTLALGSPRPAAAAPAATPAPEPATPVIVRLERGQRPRRAGPRGGGPRRPRSVRLPRRVPGYAAVLPPGDCAESRAGRGSSPSTRTPRCGCPIGTAGPTGPALATGRRTAGRRGAVGPRPHRPAHAAAVGDLHAAGRRRAGPRRHRLRHRHRDPTPPTRTSAAGSAPGSPRSTTGRHRRLRRPRHARRRHDRRRRAASRGAVSLVAVRTLDCERLGRDVRDGRRDRLGGADHPAGTPAVANLSLAGDPSDSSTPRSRAGRPRRDGRGGRRQRERRRLRHVPGPGARRADRWPRPSATTGAPVLEPGLVRRPLRPRRRRRLRLELRRRRHEELSGTSMASPHVAGRRGPAAGRRARR